MSELTIAQLLLAAVAMVLTVTFYSRRFWKRRAAELEIANGILRKDRDGLFETARGWRLRAEKSHEAISDLSEQIGRLRRSMTPSRPTKIITVPGQEIH